MSEIRIVDIQGNERSAEWLAANFGDVLIRRHPDQAPGWRLVELREREGQAILMATLRREEPAPNGTPVARTWGSDIANGVLEPTLKDLPENLATWFPRGVWGPAEGPADSEIASIAYGIGSGDKYIVSVNGRGASAIWCEKVSDVVVGLGWSLVRPDGSLTQYRTLESVFEWLDESPGPGPVDPYIEAAEALEAIGAGWVRLGALARSLVE